MILQYDIIKNETQIKIQDDGYKNENMKQNN